MDTTIKFASNVTLINVTEQDYYEDTIEQLWRVIPPILISIGTIGNAMTFFVLLRQKKMTSTAMFLFALALSDTLILFSGLLPLWVYYTWGVFILSLSYPVCQATVYLEHCSWHLSSWLIVAVTLERTACVLFPHKVRLGCSPRNAGWIIATIVFTVFGINITLVLLDTYGYAGWCNPKYTELQLFAYVQPWIHFTLIFGAPFPLLLIGNVIIVVQLALSRSRRQRMNISGQVRDTRPVSMLMIALCVLFLITILPMSVGMVYLPYQADKLLERINVDPYTYWKDMQYIYFLYSVAELVSYFNATFNFAIYVLSGPKFRAELKSLLCCKTTRGTNLFGR